MNRKSGAFGLLWTNGKQDTLASDGILALVVGLLALTLAVVVIVVVMPLADHEISPGITTGVEGGSARWSALGELYAANNEGSNGVSVAQVMEPDEAFVRSVALMGQNSVGYAAAGPCSAPVGILSMGPTEAEAYARSLTQLAQGSVGLVGGLYSGPGAAQAMEPDEVFVRSVALTGQNSVGYAAAGPCSAPVGILSMGPTEAKAYARSLAQMAQGSVRLVGSQ